MEAHFRRIAGEDEVLPEIVGDDNVLVALMERIQSAVGVFLQLSEPNQVELIAIGVQGAEQAHAAVYVVEQETAEIALEGLRTDTQRYEVVIGAEISELGLHEPL